MVTFGTTCGLQQVAHCYLEEETLCTSLYRAQQSMIRPWLHKILSVPKHVLPPCQRYITQFEAALH